MPVKNKITVPAGPYLTPQELADELRLPLETIYTWNKRGTGPRRLKFGRHVRYTRADVDAFKAGQYVTTADE
jgi:excisionase family DNA binding protein